MTDHVDTTATQSLSAYDRIVVVGDDVVNIVVEGSAGPFRYDQHPDFANVDQSD